VSEDSEWISLPENLNENKIDINPMLWHGAFIGLTSGTGAMNNSSRLVLEMTSSS
jgi:hypothetical protein